MELRSFRWVCDNENICIRSQPACRWAERRLIRACPWLPRWLSSLWSRETSKGISRHSLVQLVWIRLEEHGWSGTQIILQDHNYLGRLESCFLLQWKNKSTFWQFLSLQYNTTTLSCAAFYNILEHSCGMCRPSAWNIK